MIYLVQKDTLWPGKYKWIMVTSIRSCCYHILVLFWYLSLEALELIKIVKWCFPPWPDFNILCRLCCSFCCSCCSRLFLCQVKTLSRNVMLASFFCNMCIKRHCQREFRDAFVQYVTCWLRSSASGFLSSAECQKNRKERGWKTEI